MRLFAIDEIEGDLTTPGYSVPLTMEFLKANRALLVDTRHLRRPNLRPRLLESIGDVDGSVRWRVVLRGDFQAAHLLSSWLSKRVGVISSTHPTTLEATGSPKRKTTSTRRGLRCSLTFIDVMSRMLSPRSRCAAVIVTMIPSSSRLRCLIDGACVSKPLGGRREGEIQQGVDPNGFAEVMSTPSSITAVR